MCVTACVAVESCSTAIADKSAEVLEDVDKAKEGVKEAKGEEEKGEGKKKGKENLCPK